MSDFEHLLFSVENDIATITLNRPDNANSLNLTLAQELYRAAVTCDTTPVRAAILTGTGKMFCAGGDLAAFHQADNSSAELAQIATSLHNAIAVFNRMDAPLVIAVNGTAAGAGFSLACSGDYVLAAEHAKFTMAYSNAGLSCDGSSTFFVAKHIGLLRAKELMLTNRLLTAAEAQAWGAINEVVPPESLTEQTQKIASKFAAGPTLAHGAIKRMLNQSYVNGLETQMELETMNIANMSDTKDGAGAISAFLNKEKPAFSGR
ncbi:MAG: enoyl-CoA hydratase-related protein [Pseudomonadota bacterium]